MATLVIRPKNREEWLEYRKNGIGSSAIGTIIGCNPFESRYELWQRTLGLIPLKEENEAMIQGHELEGVVASMFERNTGYKIIKNSAVDWLFQNSDKPWELASPDRLYWLDSTHKDGNDWQAKGILECKTTMRKDVSEDNIPDMWFAQVQWQLGIGGMKEAHLAFLNKWGCEFGLKKIDFNQAIFEQLEAMAEEWWFKNIKERIAPVEMSAEDVKRVFPKEVTGKTVEASEEIVQLCYRKSVLDDQIKELESQVEEIKDKVTATIGDAETLTSACGTVLATFKANKPSVKLDAKALETDYPDIVGKYKHTVQGARVLRIKKL